MFTIRSARLPQDEAALSALDTSFETGVIYEPVRDALSFALIEKSVVPPLQKRYVIPFADTLERQNWDFTAIAEKNGELAGFAAAQYAAWNRRVVIWHLYVAPALRQQGVATQILAALDTYARSVDARCLWLETQNVNYPAIQFYRRSGFHFCGYDDSLYDPSSVVTEEIALFFARAVAAHPERDLL